MIALALVLLSSLACAPADEVVLCNGHSELCDRPLDEVTLAGTHNSMSNTEAGWLPPYQQYGLTRQLEDGVRALMLDTYDEDGQPMLCHNSCDLGSQPLAEGLAEIADFMDAHPHEVLFIIFQDNLSVDDTVAVFEEVGLSDRVWAWDGVTTPLPTLGELVEKDTRLVVSAEASGPPPDWYHGAWELFFDTPYSFASAEEFSCTLNRGNSDNPLFLVNHWISLPWPDEAEASEVNLASALGDRARECADFWGRHVNFLAVDFYATGDLFSVVDELNGLSQ